jgi:hypothetical protein
MIVVVAVGVLMNGHAANLPRPMELGHALRNAFDDVRTSRACAHTVGLAPPPASGG